MPLHLITDERCVSYHMAGHPERPQRITRTLGLPPEANEIDLVRYWRDYFRQAKMIAPREVNGGPVFENTMSGAR